MNVGLTEILDKEGYLALSPELRNRYCREVGEIIEHARGSSARDLYHDYVKKALTADTFYHFWREEHCNRARAGTSVPSLVAYTIEKLRCPELYARNVLGSYNESYVLGIGETKKVFPEILSIDAFEVLSLRDREIYGESILEAAGLKNTTPSKRFQLLDIQTKEFLGRVLKANTLEERWRNKLVEGVAPGKKVATLLSYTAHWFDINDIAKELFYQEYQEQYVVPAPEPKPLPPKAEEVVGFQICPFYRDVNGYVNQCGGADSKTEGYNVYKRLSDTSLVWHDEWSTEAEAVTCAETLSRYTGLPILRYDWQNPQAPSLAESTVAFENFAKDHPKLKSVGFSTSENAYVYAPTQTAKEVWDAACSWMRQVFAARQ